MSTLDGLTSYTPRCYARTSSCFEATGVSVTPQLTTYKLEDDESQDDRSQDLPFGTRGGTAIHHVFPLDGEYGLKISLRRNWSSPEIRGIEALRYE